MLFYSPERPTIGPAQAPRFLKHFAVLPPVYVIPDVDGWQLSVHLPVPGSRGSFSYYVHSAPTWAEVTEFFADYAANGEDALVRTFGWKDEAPPPPQPKLSIPRLIPIAKEPPPEATQWTDII
jgi:hypothetical protein